MSFHWTMKSRKYIPGLPFVYAALGIVSNSELPGFWVLFTMTSFEKQLLMRSFWRNMCEINSACYFKCKITKIIPLSKCFLLWFSYVDVTEYKLDGTAPKFNIITTRVSKSYIHDQYKDLISVNHLVTGLVENEVIVTRHLAMRFQTLWWRSRASDKGINLYSNNSSQLRFSRQPLKLFILDTKVWCGDLISQNS